MLEAERVGRPEQQDSVEGGRIDILVRPSGVGSGVSEACMWTDDGLQRLVLAFRQCLLRGVEVACQLLIEFGRIGCIP